MNEAFTSTEYDNLLSSILDIGECLLKNGAEVSRIEDTISRLCLAYGFDNINVFTITSSIVVTVRRPNGRTETQTRRIFDRNTDLGEVEKINSLSRRVCADPPSPARLEEMVREAENHSGDIRHLTLITALIYAAVSAVFAVFFGGNGADALAASLSGIFLFAILSAGRRLRINSLLLNLIVSAFTALAVILLMSAGIGVHADKICIGNIMLVIPGVQLMTALRDMINGDTLAGTLNFMEAILKALAVAMGFAFVLISFGIRI